jgi:excisionase family DNA binding protein
MNPTPEMRLAEVCARLGITETQVRLYSDSKQLASYRTFGGQRRWRRADVEAFAAKVRANGRAVQPGGARWEVSSPGRTAEPDESQS